MKSLSEKATKEVPKILENSLDFCGSVDIMCYRGGCA